MIMWYKLGTASSVGIAILLLITVPSSTMFLTMIRKFRETIASWTDKRMQLMNELIGGIQVIEIFEINCCVLPFGFIYFLRWKRNVKSLI